MADAADMPVGGTIVDRGPGAKRGRHRRRWHGHSRLSEVVLGSTSRDVIRLAPPGRDREAHARTLKVLPPRAGAARHRRRDRRRGRGRLRDRAGAVALRSERDAARGRARRRGRHEQGEHRAAPHGVRRQAGHARVAAGGARVRAAVRVRGARGDPRGAHGRPAGGLERGAAGGVPRHRGALPRERLPRDRGDRGGRALQARAPSGIGRPRRARGAGRGTRLSVHHPARLRDRGGARRMRPAPLHPGHGGGPARRGRLPAHHARRCPQHPLPGERGRALLRRDRPDAGPPSDSPSPRGAGS